MSTCLEIPCNFSLKKKKPPSRGNVYLWLSGLIEKKYNILNTIRKFRVLIVNASIIMSIVNTAEKQL